MYLDYVNELSKIVDKNIDIVFYPLSCDTIDESIKDTDIYFSKMLNYVYFNDYNINISIENLNSMVDCVRLSKDYLTSVLYNNMDLYFTYDVGHEIMEYGKLSDLDDVFIERLRNVHFHTFNNAIEHLPVDYHEYNKDCWVKALLYLKSLNFKGTLVLEYNFYELGNSYNERFDNYLNCFKFISNYL